MSNGGSRFKAMLKRRGAGHDPHPDVKPGFRDCEMDLV